MSQMTGKRCKWNFCVDSKAVVVNNFRVADHTQNWGSIRGTRCAWQRESYIMSSKGIAVVESNTTVDFHKQCLGISHFIANS
jgi:hypothetical protein